MNRVDPQPAFETPQSFNISAGAPVPLPPGQTPWLVTGGEIEVYLVTPTLRRLVALVREGGHLFPLAEAGEATLSMVATGGAELRAVSADADLAESTEAWVRRAARGLTLPDAPADALTLRPGDGGEVGGMSTLRANEGVVWVTLPGDVSPKLCGGPPVHGLQALSGPLWLSVEGAGEIDAVSTADLAATGHLAAAVAAFTQGLVALHGAMSDRADRQDAERLARAAVADAATGTAGGLLAAVSEAARALGVSLEGRVLSDPGHDINALPQLARVAGLRARKVALERDWWVRDQGPLVLRDAETAEIETLTFQRSIRGGRYRRAGGEPLSRTRAQGYESRAFALHAPLPASVDGFIPLARHVWKGMAQDSFLMGVAGAGIAGLGILTPLATGWILSDIVPAGAPGLLMAVGVALVMAALVSTVLSTARGIALARIDGRGGFMLAAALTDRVLRLPPRFFKSHSAGDLNQRLGSVEAMRKLVTSVILSSGMTLVFSLVYLVVLFFYDTRLALLALALVLGYVAAVAISRILQMKSLSEAAELDGKIANLTYETLEGVAKLRSAAAEHRAMARWAEVYTAERRAAERGARVGNHFGAFADSYQTLTLLALFAATALLARDTLPSGIFIGFLAAFGAFQGAFTGFCESLLSIYAAKPLLDRAKPVLTAEPELTSGLADPGRLSGAIEVSNLAFSYGEGMPEVIGGLSFEVHPGEHLAIVGGSGSGKSTIFRLLLGFETPLRGSITYDGQDLAHLDTTRVRSQIGVVLQASKLFAGSILENIRGASDASLEDCLAAVERAGLARDLEMFPMGIHTPITEGAATLSGGQRQRIMIARALAADPKILFFDEATSALDNATQAVVSATLDSLAATRITIAHRLSTVRNADRIGVLKGGRFVEIGSYDDLIGRGGAFAELAQRQLTDT